MPEPGGGSRPCVVVIDNDPTFLLMVRDALEDDGYRVLTTSDWRNGFLQVKAQQPGLVIVDVYFGTRREPTGLELVQAMRADPQTEDIPVIVCTAAADVVRSHANSIMSPLTQLCEKPFDLVEFLSRVRQSYQGAAMAY